MAETSISTERYVEVLEEIKQFDAEEGNVLTRINLVGLNSKERYDIYGIIEGEYQDRLKFEQEVSFDYQGKQVVLPMTKIKSVTEAKPQPVIVDDMVVRIFHQMTKIPLPNTDHRSIDYYLDHLDSYTGCRAEFARFLNDIETHGNVQKLDMRIRHVSDCMLKYLKEHPSTKTFNKNAFQLETDFIKKSPYKQGASLYHANNQNKLFISVDINKANYSIVKRYHPEIFRSTASWPEFVLSFCGDRPIHTLAFSKPARQRIFGEARLTSKTASLAGYLIRQLAQESSIPLDKVVLLSSDEIVVAYDPTLYRHLFEHYHGDFYKVQAFRLIKLPKYDFFFKEHFDPFQATDIQPIVITRRDFKCIQASFVMQCIKYYEGKPIVELDRKFLMETGQSATMDEPIF